MSPELSTGPGGLPVPLAPTYPQPGRCPYNFSQEQAEMNRNDLWETLRLGPGWEEQQAVLRWRSVVGENLARLARPLHVEDGVLHLAVASPVVATELRLWKEELLRRLAQHAPKSRVRDFRFHLIPAAKERQLPPVEPGPAELNQAEETIPEDLAPEVRNRLVRALATVLAQEATILRLGGHHCPACGAAFLGQEERCPLCRLRL